MSIVGERIRTLREKRGLGQAGLAKAARVAYQTVMRIENGDTPQPKHSTVEKLARALGVPSAQLWGTAAAPAPPQESPAAQNGATAIDIPMLTNILEASQAFLDGHRINLTSRRKAEIAAYLYQHYLLHGAMEEEAFVTFMQLVLSK